MSRSFRYVLWITILSIKGDFISKPATSRIELENTSVVTSIVLCIEVVIDSFLNIESVKSIKWKKKPHKDIFLVAVEHLFKGETEKKHPRRQFHQDGKW